MKNFLSKLNVPLLLLLGYSSYFIYIINGALVNLPAALVFVFVVLLYAFQIYMDHIKKPEPHKELEKRWQEHVKDFDDKFEKLNLKIISVNNATQMKSTVNRSSKNVW